MKLRALALIGALMFATPALAQDTPPPGGGQDEGGGRRRGGRGGEGGGRGGFGGGFGGLNIEQLKGELGLTDEQVAEAEKIAEDMRTKMREAFQSGDREGMRDRMRAMFEESFTKLEEKLTPEQKEKFKAFREQMEQRRGQFGRGRGGEGGERGRGGEGRRFGGERLREQALAALALEGEDAAVITPLLDAVLQGRDAARTEAETRRRELQQKVGETTDAEAIGKLLADYRAARETAHATALQTQEQLREVLTVEQEAKLVALGVLE